jgi:hypothetical protein
MRTLFAVLARYRADLPGGLDGALTAEADLTDARQTVVAGLRRRWQRAVTLGAEAEPADAMRAKLAAVGREGGKQPLLAAATEALRVEVGALARDENNGLVLAYMDLDSETVTAEGSTGPTWRRTLIETATRLGCRLELREKRVASAWKVA